MEVTRFSPAQFDEFLKLADREISPEGSPTRIWEDFPLILGRDNLDWVLGICRDGEVLAGLACLIRQFKTSCGTVPVAGIGHVVTRGDQRNRGLSRTLQVALLERLRQANVPLAVLWTDDPGPYRGRGFAPAGWEFHVDLAPMESGEAFPAGFSNRPFHPNDTEAVAALHDRHPYRTLRHPGDPDRLYAMPGTRGLVAAGADDTAVAAVFCGKGADFPDYVAEWAGPKGLVVPLLEEVRRRGWAGKLLVPAGGEKLAEVLAGRGAVVTAAHSGHWAVLQPEQLSLYLQGAGHGAPADPADPVSLLGTVDAAGVVSPGALTLAVWGFDSV